MFVLLTLALMTSDFGVARVCAGNSYMALSKVDLNRCSAWLTYNGYAVHQLSGE